MKNILVALCLAACSTLTHAEDITATFESSYGPTTLILSDTPCTNKTVLESIKAEFQPLFQAGSVSAPDIKRVLCWAIPPGEPGVFLIDDAGEIGNVPLEIFTKPTGKVGA